MDNAQRSLAKSPQYPLWQYGSTQKKHAKLSIPPKLFFMHRHIEVRPCAETEILWSKWSRALHDPNIPKWFAQRGPKHFKVPPFSVLRLSFSVALMFLCFSFSPSCLKPKPISMSLIIPMPPFSQNSAWPCWQVAQVPSLQSLHLEASTHPKFN